METLHFDLLKRLCETPGIAGREEQLIRLVREQFAGLVDETRTDALGNVLGLKRATTAPAGGATTRRVMLAAHMDEIGFLVRHIDDKGYLRLQPVGGFDARNLIAQRVLVHSSTGRVLRGVLQPASKPIHLLEPAEANKPPKLETLFVDVGLPVEEVKEAVEPGTMVTMDRTTEWAGETVISKSLDDRVGVFVMLEALRILGTHSVDVLAVATTQEEVGLRGAGTAAFGGEPHIGVALDITLAVESPGGSDGDAITHLGQGAAIKIMDSSSISHPALVRQFKEIARREGIPVQMEILPRGGTDAGAIQRSRAGVPSITLSIPTRYVHTVNEMAHPRDITACISLLARYLEEAHQTTLDY
ncbi:MAG: M42 family metallopeptidase [Chloroflexota bacterium]